MKINCIVIDDELPAIKQLELYIERIPFLNLIGSFDNAIEPLSFIKENQVDLIFLDIEMEGFNGLQMVKTLKFRPKIILTTAYDQYAIEAFDMNVTDYLLKPISFERFIKSVDRIFDETNHLYQQQKEPQYKRDFFFVKTEYKMQRVDFDQILYVEGMREYLKIHTQSERILVLQSFKELEESLPSDRFIRIHKSYLVAINKIEYLEKNRVKILDQLIPVSDTYKEAVHMAISKQS